MNNTFNVETRAAVAELVTFAHALSESENPVTRTIAALCCERAARLVEGSSGALLFSNEEVVNFYTSWQHEMNAIGIRRES